MKLTKCLHRYGREVKNKVCTGETLREITRNLLLLTTPHNGKPDDFLLFMSLLDPERFEEQVRSDGDTDTEGVMRRLVKERLVTLDGTPLFLKGLQEH